MDAVTDPSIETVTVIKGARVGYTKVLDNVIGYFIHQDPCPILVVQPRVEDAEDYSRTEVAPMLRDTPVLAEIAGDLKAKDSEQRIAKRVFKNGSSVSFVGANSPGGFRRITARIVLFDEVDGYPPQGAGIEGDQVALGKKRSESFWNRKIVLGSTPTVKVTSRIVRSWEQSDQRRYYVPCPHCAHKQALKWANIRWTDGDPETAHYVCEENGCVIEESDKPWMIERGEWLPGKETKTHAGFHIWAGYSLFPNAAWRHLVAEFLSVKNDPTQLRTFVNLVLGEAWEEQGEEIDQHVLQARANEEGWRASDERDGRRMLRAAPDGVLLVTCGVDVQGDRVEIERVGWGMQEESWSLEYEVIYGDPAAPGLWADLDEYLLTPTVTEDGRELGVAATAIDSGGSYTDAVYTFVRNKSGRRVWAIKGASTPRRPVWPKLASKNNKGRIPLFIIGTDSAKDIIFGRFRIDKSGPGYCHFPQERDGEWFVQVTGEVMVTRYRKGIPYEDYVPKPNVRHEALDCRVYAFAALRSMRIHWPKVQRILMEKQAADAAEAAESQDGEARPKPKKQPQIVRSRFLGR